MRWRTYRRAEEKCDRYDAVHDEGLLKLVAKFGMKPGTPTARQYRASLRELN